MKKVIFVFIVFFILFNQKLKAKEFKKAPDFYLWGPDVKMVGFPEFKGKIVLVNFWGTWLITKSKQYLKTKKPSGDEEIIRLNSLYSEYKNKNVKVVGICVDQISTTKFKKLIKKLFEVDFYILLSNGGVVEKDFGGVPVIPTTFIIDKKGYIRYTFQGGNDIKIYKKAIESLLKEKD